MRSVRRVGFVGSWMVFAVLVLALRTADARITIRSGAGLDEFRFHAQYWDEAFDPAAELTLAIWICADGGMPMYVAGSDPAVVCRSDAGATAAADLAYGVVIDGGTCVDHGQACYVRLPETAVRNGGVRYFKVQYAKRGAGNKIWLEALGDLSRVGVGNMLLQILIDGRPRALLEGNVVPFGSRALSIEF